MPPPSECWGRRRAPPHLIALGSNQTQGNFCTGGHSEDGLHPQPYFEVLYVQSALPFYQGKAANAHQAGQGDEEHWGTSISMQRRAAPHLPRARTLSSQRDLISAPSEALFHALSLLEHLSLLPTHPVRHHSPQTNSHTGHSGRCHLYPSGLEADISCLPCSLDLELEDLRETPGTTHLSRLVSPFSR